MAFHVLVYAHMGLAVLVVSLFNCIGFSNVGFSCVGFSNVGFSNAGETDAGTGCGSSKIT